MSEVENDSFCMRLALREAKKGQGRTSPNPTVGAVVVRNNQVVGKGYHRRAGDHHAEVNALHDAGALARDATIYVTLEPCNHTGRTPPCTQAIMRAGIRRVVIGMADPNSQVAGGGADFLASQGVAVTTGVLEKACLRLNRPFLKHVTLGMPWVILKAGMSLDGRIAVASGQSGWITGEKSRRMVHRLRDRFDAILVGIGTAQVDDPSLTTRLTQVRGRDPLRVVLDSKLQLDPTCKMLHQESEAPTWIFCADNADDKRQQTLEQSGAIIRRVASGPDGRLDLQAVLAELGASGVQSLLVEGGGQVHGAFLRQQLVDQVMLFIAPRFIGGDGIPVVGGLGLSQISDGPQLKQMRTRRLGPDILLEGIMDWVQDDLAASD